MLGKKEGAALRKEVGLQKHRAGILPGLPINLGVPSSDKEDLPEYSGGE